MFYLSKPLAAKTKPSKFAGEHIPQTPRSRHDPVVAVKTEPVDADEGFHRGLFSPIVISSEEELTPKTKSTKGNNFPSSPTKEDFSRASRKLSLLNRPVPRPKSLGKGKEAAADTEEQDDDLPGGSQQPLSESTVYLEDMWVLP